MKIFLTNIFLMVIVSVTNINLYAKKLDLNTLKESDGYAALPKREISSNLSSITITYTFNECDLIEDPENSGSFYCFIPGFGQTTILGKASVPEKLDAVYIPWKAGFTIELVDSTFVDFPCKLSLSKGIINPGGSVINPTKITPTKIGNMEYSKNAASIYDEQYMRGNRILHVLIRPVNYNPSTKCARILKSLTYKISMAHFLFGERAPINIDNLPHLDRELLANMTINSGKYEIADSIIGNLEETCEEDPQSYIIVSTPKFKDAVDRLARWKRTLGFTTYVELNSSWTTAQIQSLIQQRYNSDEDLRYMIILGDIDDVPSCPFVSAWGDESEDKYSDNIYGCLDGEDDYTNEIFVGRISVSNSTEANQFINRLINYMANPVKDLSFYQNLTAIAGFDGNQSNKTQEHMPFIQTCEIMRSHIAKQKVSTSNPLLKFNRTMNRIYRAYDNETPMLWQFGDSMPRILQKPNFPWTGSPSDISSTINKGCMLAFINTHGRTIALLKPSWDAIDAKELKNGNKMPLIIATTTCLIGNFSKNCIAESMQRNPNGGAIAMIANSQLGYSPHGDALALCLINSLWPTPPISAEYAYPNKIWMSDLDPIKKATPLLGPLLATSLANMQIACPSWPDVGEYHHRVTHIFGDPGMDFTTDPPTEFEKLSITYNESGEVYIHTPLISRQNLIVASYDTITTESRKFIGTGIRFTPTNPKSTIISVYGHNKIPKSFTYDDIMHQQQEKSKSQLISIGSIYPSPANNEITIVFNRELCGNYSVILSGTTNSINESLTVDRSTSEIKIDTSKYPNGVYTIALYINGHIEDTKKIAVKH